MISHQCIQCNNYLGGLKCSSFFGGISFKILSGKHDHNKPIGGENKKRNGKPILFEPIKRQTS